MTCIGFDIIKKYIFLQSLNLKWKYVIDKVIKKMLNLINDSKF